MTKRRYIFIAFAYFAVFAATVTCTPGKTLAANTSIVGGTNGSDCSSGGYFTPSTVTVNSGDTVTISVPAGDPYAGGMEVHFSNGLDYTIARGGSQTTAPLTASVTYYGTWPSSGCLKGSGTITVNAPAPSPPAPSPPPPAAPSPPANSGGGSGSSSGSGKSSVSPTPSSATTPEPVQQPSSTASSQPPAGTAIAPQSQSSQTVATDTAAKMPMARNVRVMRTVGISAGVIVTVVVAGAVVWIFVLRRG